MSDRSKAYREAGVDIQAGNEFVSRLKSLAGSTFTKGVVTDIGGFGGLFKPDVAGLKDPVLVASADGVGTKLKLAIEFKEHVGVGIDLVAMSVNDILVQGAAPLFFLDYMAFGKLDQEVALQVIEGIAQGCKDAGCALLGGETAEMPGMYHGEDYDLSGFCVGLVDNDKIVDGSSIGIGDAIIGVASSGPHSNGFSLIRKILAASGLSADDPLPGAVPDETGAVPTMRQALLKPTRIYVKQVRNIMRELPIKGMVHVTGGGFYDNIPRVLPKGVAAHIDFASWELLPVFDWLKTQGDLTWPEMLQIFNCGVGFILIMDDATADDAIGRLQAQGERAWRIGTIQKRQDDEEQVVVSF